MQHKIFDFFPIPKSLAMHTSGVAISDRAVQFVRFSRKRAVELEAFGEVPLSENTIDAGGVADQKEFVKVLTNLKSKYKLSLIEVSIPEEKSYLFKTTVLGENFKEIKSNIELQIQDNVPFKLSEVVFDFSIIGEAKGKKRDVVVSVLPRTVVENYLSAFHEAGLVPLSFQVESQAVTQAVVPQKNKDSVLVINIQGEKAGFYIVTGHTVRFSSTVSVGAQDTQVHIFDGSSEDTVQEPVKEDLDGVSLKTLLREIHKILTYWKTHDGEDGTCDIKHIYLTGMISDETKMTDYIGSNISMPVEISNVWQNAFSFDALIPDMERKDSLRFAAAIGLALFS